jgi:hypothetical protein
MSAAIRRSRDSLRFADRAAFAAIFVPSIAIVPTRPIPARAHSSSTWVNSSPSPV